MQARYNEIKKKNQDILQMMSRYLNETPDFIQQETIDEIVTSCHVSTGYAFQVILAAACGLDIDDDPYDRILFNEYFPHMFHELSTTSYANNPYYQNIDFPTAIVEQCQLRNDCYKPYEAFVCNDMLELMDGHLMPQIGYFKESFSYPAILENDRIWMTVTPNEIETMKQPIEEAFGHVLTFGLGLGYYAYMVAEKPEVLSVTVVELNPKVISLFQQYLLPQFPHKDKLTIVKGDAVTYARYNLAKAHFDYVFTDLWHDVSDGIPMFLKMKEMEQLNSKPIYSYWIENTLKCYL